MEQPPSYEEATGHGLLRNRRHSLHLREVVELYMMRRKTSGLDGSIHPALDTTSPNIRLDKTTHQWETVPQQPTKEEQKPPLEEKDPDRHKWKDEEEPEDVNVAALYKDVEKDQEEFKNALKDFESKADAKLKIGIDFEKTYSVDDVLVSIENAKKKYAEKERKGIFAPLRKAFRRLGNSRDTAKAYLSFLPGESQYFSVIYGGLVFIIEAAGRLSALNDEIAECIGMIPTMIDRSQRALRVFSKSNNLRDLVSRLYTGVIQALSRILAYYRLHAFPKLIKVTFKQGSFLQELSEDIRTCKLINDAVQEELVSCHVEMNRETNKVTKKGFQLGKEIYEKTGLIEEQGQFIRAKLEEMEVAQRVALEGITKMFMGSPGPDSSKLHTPSVTPKNSPQRSQSKVPTPQKARRSLMKRLDTSQNNPKRDRRANLKHGLAMAIPDQDRAVHIIQSETLHLWLGTPTSSILLINSNRPGSNGLRSSVSFVSAKLADTLRLARKSAEAPIINLHFFCGEHANWRDDPDNSPTGLMASLLAQLLTQYRDFDLSEIINLDKMDTDNINNLLVVFTKLVARLPKETMVFCIIDSVSVYEAGETADDVEVLLDGLIALARGMTGGKHCVLKLLLTAPVSLRSDAVDGLDEHEVLHVPERLEKRGGFTDMKWDLGAGGDISDLAGLELSG